MDSRGTEKLYKYTGAEGSQIGYFNIYLYAPRTKVKWIYSQNGGGRTIKSYQI